MRSRASIIGLVLLGSVSLCSRSAGQDEQSPVAARINFIVNEGLVLLTTDDRGVLIDALFRESVGPYGKLPPATAEQMETAQKPFDRVKLVLVTHKHADHFDAKSVTRFLENNAEARLLSSQQVVDEVKRAAGDREAIGDRLSTLAASDAEPARFEADGINVEALALSHGSGEVKDVVNYGYIVEIGGKRLLHVGDAQLTKQTEAALASHAVGVDCACVPYWWLMEKAGREFLTQTLKPRTVAAFHIPPGQAEEIGRQIHANMPQAIIFDAPWTSKWL